MARLPAWALKMGTLAISLMVIWGVSKLFFPELLETTGGWIMAAALLISGIACVVLYDLVLTKLITRYFAKWQKRFHLK